MFYLESNELAIAIDSHGAELKRIFHKGFGIEYLWQRDPAYWAKSSPVLFPIVGALKNDTFYYNGKAYTLPRHGFAREKKFNVTAQQKDALRFVLESDQNTEIVYPFSFLLSIEYTLSGATLTTKYQVENRGPNEMFFSIGGHPAFNVPLLTGTAYDEYSLVFDAVETAGRWPVTKEGLIGKEPEPLLNNTKKLPLSKELFQQDALVLKHLNSKEVKLESNKTEHGLQFSFSGFPYLGLWAAPGADFICIEPWCGIADAIDTDQQLEHKEGIQKLGAGETFQVQWQAQFY